MPAATKSPRRRAIHPTAEAPRAPVEARADPIGWDLDSTEPQWRLANLDPDLHYVWANKDPQAAYGMGTVEFYEARGYEPVIYNGQDGPRPLIGKPKSGSWIERQNLVLMAIDNNVKTHYEGRAQARHNALVASMADTTKRQIRQDLRDMPGNRNEEYMSLRKTNIQPGKPVEMRD